MIWVYALSKSNGIEGHIGDEQQKSESALPVMERRTFSMEASTLTTEPLICD